MEEEIIKEIKSVYINCPFCEDLTDDDQYTCTACWHQGGNGKINVFDYIKGNPSILE